MGIEALKAVHVRLSERSYPILVGGGLLDRLGEALEKYVEGVTRSAVIVSPIVDNLYGERTMQAMSSLSPIKLIVPEGENAKSWDRIEELVGDFIKFGLDRKSVIVALGGGSVGDSAGFAASIYLRGIRVVQVPTTLLGQVDSGIGGKTAVNHPSGKNLIGSFHQPSLVVCDTNLISSLPSTEFRSGLAEVVKYGVIADANLFELLEHEASKLLSLELETMTNIIAKCAAIKARYVEIDEHDQKGVRAALNFGHTIGHAIETRTNHSARHGEAVSVGMITASKVAVTLGLLKIEDLLRLEHLLNNIGLPIRTDIEASTLVSVMQRDKKAEAGIIKLVLPTGIGSPPVLRPIQKETIIEALEA